MWAREKGFVANEWQWCFRTNSTYEDCPIAAHATDQNLRMMVGVHNPANLPMKVAKIAVPHGNLSVQVFDGKEMVSTDADVLCNAQLQELDSTKTVNNCQLYVKYEIKSYSLGLIMVSYDADADLANKTSDQTEMKIESEDLILTYEPEFAGEGVFFAILDKQSGESKTLGFDVRYWQSYQNSNHQSSGVYIFKPDTGSLRNHNYESYPYGSLSSIGVTRG